MSNLPPDDGPVDVVVVPRTHELGDNFEVRRALPSRQRRMVGPYVFLDQMGPHVFAAGQGLDVRPHPHIGLATVTYLYEGEILHRQLGCRAAHTARRSQLDDCRARYCSLRTYRA